MPYSRDPLPLESKLFTILIRWLYCNSVSGISYHSRALVFTTVYYSLLIVLRTSCDLEFALRDLAGMKGLVTAGLVAVASGFASRLSGSRHMSSLLATTVSAMGDIGLNIAEYPDDDYDHILGINDPQHTPSRLQKICSIRMKDVELSKTPLDVQGCGIDRNFYVSEEDLQTEIQDFDEQFGTPFNLSHRIAETYPSMAIAAEFKRASPSKGDINPNVDIEFQTLQYASAGSAVISVLTEFKHFKGTLADMRRVRLATQRALANHRPAILRKDFILDRYQIFEARANGADTVLLIVAVLGVNQLKDLIATCRKLKMEPLVEVHTQREMVGRELNS